MRVVAVLACHNRKACTLRCLERLRVQRLPSTVDLRVVAVDDGSTDGTSTAIASVFPNTVIIRGNGQLYWSRAMRLGQIEAERLGADYVLWLNDDVLLDPDALERLIDASSHGDIVAGGLTDSVSGSVTYSGYLRCGTRPRRLKLVEPGSSARDIDSFNGNVVLIGRRARQHIGTIDPLYEHAYGDHDYAFRAKKAGLRAVLAAGTVGVCDRNDACGTWADTRLSRWTRMRLLFGRKGLPPKSHFRFTRRHAGPAWPVIGLAGYLKPLAVILFRRRAKHVRAVQISDDPARVPCGKDTGGDIARDDGSCTDDRPSTDG